MREQVTNLPPSSTDKEEASSPRRIGSLASWHLIPLGAAAAFALGLMLVPQAVWHHSPDNAVYSGFDGNLVHTNPVGGGTTTGSIKVMPGSIEIVATPGSRPTLDLLSSDSDFVVTAGVRLSQIDSASPAPLTVTTWSPREATSYSLEFGPPPDYKVTGLLKLADRQTNSVVLGSYSPGVRYQLSIALDRRAGRLSIALIPGDESGNVRTGTIQMNLVPNEAAPLFYRLPVAVTITAASEGGQTDATLDSYRLVVPQQPPIERIDSWAATAASGLLVLLSLLLCIWWLVRGALQLRASRPIAITAWPLAKWRPYSASSAALGFGVVAYLVFNVGLFGLGSHTFDMASQKVWSYVAAYYGPAELSFLPQTVTPADVFGGVPFAAVGYPYGPVLTWFFTGVGWIWRLTTIGSSVGPLQSHGLEYVLKAVNVLFTLLDGLFIYLVLARAGVQLRIARIASALFVLNPAVWFLTSVWGETQTVTLSLVLAALWSAQRARPTLAWTLLAVAALTRPQLIVPSAVLGILFLRWFHQRINLIAIAWAIVVAGLIMAPLFFTLGPSLPADYLFSSFHLQAAADPHADQYNYVSFDAYSIWPLITGLISGQVGKNRIYFAGSSLLVGGLTYRQIATIAVFVALSVISLWAAFRGKRTLRDGTYTTLLASSTMALFMLADGVAAQHFVIALAFVVLSVNVMPKAVYYPLVAGLSVTTFVSTYGSLGYAISAAPTLAPALWAGSNKLTALFMNLFTNDYFITGGVLANVSILICVALASVSGRVRSDEHLHPAAGLAHMGPTVQPTKGVLRRVGDVRSPWIARGLIALCGVGAIYILSITNYLNFFYDEWDFVSWFRPSESTSIWIPHNEHWSTIPILIWKGLFLAFGIRSHVPYELATVVVHLACVLLLFEFVRRRSGDLPAFGAALTLMLFGSGGTDIVWAFQIGFLGSVAFGLLAMLLIGDSTRLPWRVAAVSVALVGSLMCSGVGLAFLVAVAVALLADRGRRFLLTALIVPVAAYGIWFATYGSGVPGSPGLGADFRSGHFDIAYVGTLANFVTFGVQSAVAGIFGWAGIGAPLLPFVCALVAVHWYRQGRIEGWQLGLAAGVLAQLTLTGLVRAQNGTAAAGEPRYMYVAAAFLLPLLADAARDLPWRGAWRPALAAAFVLCLVGNISQLQSRALDPVPTLTLQNTLDAMKIQTAELQTAEVFRGAPDMAMYQPLDAQIMPQLVAARYFAAVDELGSPVPPATLDTLDQLPGQAVNRVMTNLFGGALSLKPDASRSPAGMPCKIVDSTFGSNIDVQVADTEPLMLQSITGGDASLYIWFRGPRPAESVSRVHLQPSTAEWLHVPDTGKAIVWHLRIQTAPSGLERVCGASSLQLSQTVNYLYQGAAADGARDVGWLQTPDPGASAGRAVKATLGTPPFKRVVFGVAAVPVAQAYDIWYRVRVASPVQGTPEMTLGLWDDTDATWAGFTTFRANQLAASYSWVRVAANVTPRPGHYVQFIASTAGTLKSEWYVDEAVMTIAGSPAPA